MCYVVLLESLSMSNFREKNFQKDLCGGTKATVTKLSAEIYNASRKRVLCL